LEVLGHYGFPVIPRACARSLHQAWDQGERLGYPLALKLAIPYVAHKFDVGGVHLNLKSPEDLKQAYYQLQDLALKEPAAHEGFTVVLQKMSLRGREIILGGKQDDNFGPVIAFGIGGLYVEVIGDVVLRVAPINRTEARSMIAEIKGIKLLQGVRGQKSSDFETIVDAVVRLSDLLTDFPQIAEIDINPLMVYEAGNGGQVLDARMVLEK
jgi:acyl-CoA synthetase (NDP forming)